MSAPITQAQAEEAPMPDAPDPRDAALERFAAWQAGTDPDTIAARKLAGDVAILERFDLVRHGLGHDYGVGQRRGELNRQGLKLRRLGNSVRARLGDELVDAAMLAAGYEADRYGLDLRETAPLTAQELAEAFDRVAGPRRRRLEREDFRTGTPATRRTAEAWARVARVFDAAAAEGSR